METIFIPASRVCNRFLGRNSAWTGCGPRLGPHATLCLQHDSCGGISFPPRYVLCLCNNWSLTTILFGIPGEAVSVALVMDGYPMSKKGEAGRAMGAALMSSLIGALIGAAFLTIAIPVVRPLVLFFAAPEMFMLVIIGLTCLSTLSGQGRRGLIQGMLTAGIGLLFSLIGQDSLRGIHRYTFDSLYLMNGLPLIPVMVGIYAIPEIIELIVRGTPIAGEISPGRLGKG